MFRAVGRWFRSLGYFLTGRVDSSRRKLDTDPQAMRAKYDDVIKEKTKRIHEYKEAVAGLIAQQEKKLGSIKQLGDRSSAWKTSRPARWPRLSDGLPNYRRPGPIRTPSKPMKTTAPARRPSTTSVRPWPRRMAGLTS